MLSHAEARLMLDGAFHAALHQQEALMGAPYVCVPTLDVVEDDAFWALIQAEGDGFTLRVSTATAMAVTTLMQGAADDPALAGLDTSETPHVALTWLMLHELEHVDMGHFDLAGRSAITETDQARRFALVQPAEPAMPETWRSGVAYALDRCLELQADHNAIELILDSYSTDGWDELLARVAAISAMMILIEKHDEGSPHEAGASHPKAATRMFQLLGHVAEMWQLPERMRALQEGRDPDPARMPDHDEIAAFQQRVVIPAFTIAKGWAERANARSINADLGTGEAFFTDIGRAQLIENGKEASLQTTGAQEWRALLAANQLILEQLPELGVTAEEVSGQKEH